MQSGRKVLHTGGRDTSIGSEIGNVNSMHARRCVPQSNEEDEEEQSG